MRVSSDEGRGGTGERLYGKGDERRVIVRFWSGWGNDPSVLRQIEQRGY